ncbi:aminopeptidase N isoform X1 [Esox lucius]|uniref:Aminopeptidase n=2 Tax=Esox lucius TaxID=8010 RepID=A0A3P8XYX0_ESOLU|nr:aminopeptidase N isoform X1 [Esox lucius]
MEKSRKISKLCILCIVLGMLSVATIVTLWSIALTDSRVVTAPWDIYRLPDTLKPDHYKLTLWPRLTANEQGLYIFTGKSYVVFQCVKETDLILIHSNKLNYTKWEGGQLAKLTALGNITAPTIKSSWLKETTQYLVMQLNGYLTVGEFYQMDTEFVGELADDLSGFYRSEYEENEVKKVLATSQMHPTYTRKTFPCFDEPAMKAVFHITLLHPRGTVALSNSKQQYIVNTTVKSEAVSQTGFEPTKTMSTYLLALIVCDYAYISAQEGDILIRIWARRKAIGERHGEYALNLTGPILSFFEVYYNTSYPLAKSDQIALPDFYFGAMENWGLVTYRETNLLYDPLISSNSNKEKTATIIAHELAHMWFGNLVTLRWWNEVWLNEGFATYVSYLGADYAEPTWNVKDLIVLKDVHRVFAIDALASSHPLSSKENEIIKPEQISEQFDAISYSKGASVLRMLSDFLTEPVFVQGLSSYLHHFAYSNTVATDLWNHLQLAVDASGMELPSTVNDIMNRWVLQRGFPVITIDTANGHVSQEHFLLDPDSVGTVPPSEFKYEWIVPIKWMDAGVVQEEIWLLEKEASNKNLKSDQWVLANINVTGYYRVNYNIKNWERLLVQLSTDHQIIPVINRAQLVDDAFNLARAQLILTTLALNTTKYLSKEREYMPWESAMDNLDYFYLMFDRTGVYEAMQDYVRNLVTPLFLHFKSMTSNWTKVPEGHTDQYNQANAIRVACSTGLEECLNLTKGWYKQWMDNPDINPIHPNLRTAVYCSAIAAGGAVEWDFGWNMLKNATIATETDKLMSALACTKDKKLLNRYLEYTLDSDKIRKQDATSVIVYIANNLKGQTLAWEFVTQNWEYMFTQYGVGSFSFANLISGVTMRFSTNPELDQLYTFKQENSDIGFGSGTMALEQAIERTKANIKWVDKNQKEVWDWFLSETE